MGDLLPPSWRNDRGQHLASLSSPSRPSTSPMNASPTLKASPHRAKWSHVERVPIRTRSSRRIAQSSTDRGQNATVSHHLKKEGDGLSRSSAIPIPLSDLLLRSSHSQRATKDRSVGDKADGQVLEGLIGVENNDIKPYPAWDDADSQEAVDVDGKDLSSNVPVPAILQCSDATPTVIKSVGRTAHGDSHSDSEDSHDSHDNSDDDNNDNNDSNESNDRNDSNDTNDDSNDKNENNASIEKASLPERNSCSTTTPPPSDALESGINQSAGSGSFTTPGYGGAPTFGGPTPSPSGGQNSRKRNRSALAIGSGKDSSRKSGSPLPLVCWYAAKGYPCRSCNGKVYKSPKVQHLLHDHFRKTKNNNNHLLHEKCQRCELLFIDESSWVEHQKWLKSTPSCPLVLDDNGLQRNRDATHKGISPAHMVKVSKAIEQYMADRVPRGCTVPQHDDWINANYELYIANSTVSEQEARYELGKWLVVWCAIFPDEKIPTNPFAPNTAGSSADVQFRSLIHRGLAEQSQNGYLPSFSDEQQDIILQICGDARITSEITQHKEVADLPHAKRRRAKASGANSAEQGLSLDRLGDNTGASSEEQGQPPDRVGDNATSIYTPNPVETASYFGSAATDPSSYDDPNFVDHKVLDGEGQMDEERGGYDPMNILSVGAQYGPQYLPVNNSMQSGPTVSQNLGQCDEWNQNTSYGNGA